MPSHRASSPVKVLIVDDDVTFSRSMCWILVDAGYDCSEAASGAAARQALDNGDIAAVLCDLRLPGESGLDLLASLSADFPEVAVVVTTGVGDPPTAAMAFEIGAYGYLVKPFAPNEICITLAGALQRRDLESARRSHLRGLERTVSRLARVQGVVSQLETGPPPSRDDETGSTERLSRAVGLPHEETGAHIERMSRYSGILAEAIGYSDFSAEEFRLAASFHDLGKVGVPDSILSKTAALTPEEYRAVQRHTTIGYQLLAGSTAPMLRLAASMALGHHEWWDGSGYPRGLQGEDIPLEARIVAVADVFDASTSDRVYRPALRTEDAVEMMIQLRGRQFEPRLLDVFVGLLDQAEAIRAAYPDPTDEPRIRVLVVDSDALHVRGLMRVLGAEPSITVVGTAGTAALAKKVAVATAPDVVLMAFELPDGGGIRATEAIRVLVPSAHIVMVSDRTDQQAVMQAIGAGCAGFVARTVPVETLIEAILSVHEGEGLSPVIGPPSLPVQLSANRRGLGSDLRPRELEVLRLLAAGVSNRAVAERLYISLNTVRNHVQSILYKLDAHSKLEAVSTAVREGVIELDQQEHTSS
jgi:putative two-component system response regulator